MFILKLDTEKHTVLNTVKEYVKFVWSKKAKKKTFEILKNKITDKVVLSKFDSEANLIFKSDASHDGVMLVQFCYKV